jgi:hypothetical protein
MIFKEVKLVINQDKEKGEIKKIKKLESNKIKKISVRKMMKTKKTIMNLAMCLMKEKRQY